MPEKDYYQFQLSFKGQLVENSVDAFDVANTILATSQALQEIADIRFGEASKKIRININAFQEGSLTTKFILFLYENKELMIPLIPYTKDIYEVGKNILSSLGTIIEVKKLLKGEPPKDVKAIDNRQIKITGKDNSTTIINYYDFRALQNKTISKDLNKMVQPLAKEGSLLEELELIDETNKKSILKIKKNEAIYLKSDNELQILEEIKYKGMITKIDTKARSGYIDIANKRLPFHFDKTIQQEKFDILVESLKKRIQIFLIGRVEMDYENNPIHMQVIDVQSEIKLFD